MIMVITMMVHDSLIMTGNRALSNPFDSYSKKRPGGSLYLPKQDDIHQSIEWIWRVIVCGWKKEASLFPRWH
jgi:hypothetical protein